MEIKNNIRVVENCTKIFNDFYCRDVFFKFYFNPILMQT